MKQKRPSQLYFETASQVYISFKSSGCSWDYKAALRLLYVSLSSVLAFKGMIHLLLITCLNKLIKHESLGRHLYIQYITLNRNITFFRSDDIRMLYRVIFIQIGRLERDAFTFHKFITLLQSVESH